MWHNKKNLDTPEEKIDVVKDVMGGSAKKKDASAGVSIDQGEAGSFPGTLHSVNIDKSDNGYTLSVQRMLDNEKGPNADVGRGSDMPPTEGLDGKIKHYKTVHMKPEHVLTALSHHLIKGQVGSI